MKKLLTISLILLLSAFLNAQGTLQFNNVELIELSLTSNGSTSEQCTSQSITVPPGQVWKIVSASAGRVSSSHGFFRHPTTYIKINNFGITGNSGVEDIPYQTTPVWLPANTYTFKLCETYSSGGVMFYGYVNAIVFNVVP